MLNAAPLSVVTTPDGKRLKETCIQIYRLKNQTKGDRVQSQFITDVVAMAPAIAAQITISSPPRRRENTAIKLCFAVPSLVAARENAALLGGELNDQEREWQFQGHRVCDGHDPEGNVVQVRARVL